jgi:antigen flippase
MSAIPSEIQPPVEPTGLALSPVVPIPEGGEPSYGQILKSSALIGGTTMLNIGVGIIRTKAMAWLLGPVGVGLIGIYGSILNLTQSLASMGIPASGVRQIAEAVGSGDAKQIRRTATVLRRTAIAFGLLGALILVVFSKWISTLTFGNNRYAGAIAALALAVLLNSVAGGQTALLRGVRRISDLAKMGVLGMVFGTVISILLVYFFRERGIVPSLVSMTGIGVLTAWWYTRKVKIQNERLTFSQWRKETSGLLTLGLAFSASSILTLGADYAVRLMLLRKVSFEAAGLYQSAWTLGELYVGFILQAMTTDFYPRLTAVAKNNTECNRLVNEQAEIGLLLAGPGVMATMTVAPLVIALFYTDKFSGAVEPLRWICFGMALRVVAWPMGFVILAKGVQSIFFWTELAATVVHVGLAFLLVSYFGLSGAAMAFFGLYVWHGILIYVIVNRLSGFRWSRANRRIGLLYLPLISAVFCAFQWLSFWFATLFGAVAATLAGIYSLRVLLRLVPLQRMPRLLRQLLVGLRIAPPGII